MIITIVPMVPFASRNFYRANAQRTGARTSQKLLYCIAAIIFLFLLTILVLVGMPAKSLPRLTGVQGKSCHAR